MLTSLNWDLLNRDLETPDYAVQDTYGKERDWTFQVNSILQKWRGSPKEGAGSRGESSRLADAGKRSSALDILFTYNCLF